MKKQSLCGRKHKHLTGRAGEKSSLAADGQGQAAVGAQLWVIRPSSALPAAAHLCVAPRTPQRCSCWVVLQLRLLIRLEKLGGTQKKHRPLGFVHLLLYSSFIKYLHPLPYVWSNPDYVRKSHCAVSCARGRKYSDPCTKCQRSCTVLLSSKEGLLYSLFPF